MEAVRMKWIRCPCGCYFELPEREWERALMYAEVQLASHSCHRTSDAQFYCEDAKSSAVTAVGSVEMPDEALQQELEATVALLKP